MLATSTAPRVLRTHLALRPSLLSCSSFIPHTSTRSNSSRFTPTTLSATTRQPQTALLHTTPPKMAPADPYTAKASEDASLDQKKEELNKITKEAKFSMLTSRSSDGQLHSRAMSPASTQGLVYSFIANRESGKFDELSNDPNVNVSFSDPSSSDWASVAGTAKVNTNVEDIKKLWSPMLKSWFGAIDEKHNGEPGDDRIAIIEVIPTEVSYILSGISTFCANLLTFYLLRTDPIRKFSSRDLLDATFETLLIVFAPPYVETVAQDSHFSRTIG